MNYQITLLLSVASLMLTGCLESDDDSNSSQSQIPPTGDTTAPILSAGAPNGVLPATSREVTISLSSDEPATCRYGSQPGVSYASISNTFSTSGDSSHRTIVSGLNDGEQYTYFVRCSDASGNTNNSDFTIQFTVGATVPVGDTTAPLRSNAAPSGVLVGGTTSTEISLSTDENAACRFGSQPGISFSNLPNTFTQTGSTNHATSINGLVSDETYTFYVRCEDAFGNPNADDFQIQFAVAAATADMNAPIRSNGTPSGTLSSGTQSIDMTLSTDEIATCRFGTESGLEYANLPEVFSNTGSTNHSTLLTGLVDGEIYDFSIRCEDISGNANNDDYSVQFMVASPPSDSTAPIRSNGAPNGVLPSGTQSIDISLTTDENAVCRYDIQSGRQYSQMTTQFNGTGNTSHVTTVNGLADGSQYSFYVKCADFSSNANDDDFEIRFSVASATTGITVSDSFDGNGPLIDYVTNNESSLPNIARVNGRYRAELTNNTNNITLHFHNDQGRLDAKEVSFPFEYIARNIGIGTISDSQSAPAPGSFDYIFAGIQVHVLDLESRNSAHFVVGHRGSTPFTVEGKNTVNGSSTVNDAGANILPDGRADLRVVGQADKTLTWYWQTPNPNPGVQSDNWTLYRGTGSFPGSQAMFGDQVYIGLITYAFQQGGVPFVGTADSVELVGE